MNFISVIAIPIFIGILINLISTVIIKKFALQDNNKLVVDNNRYTKTNNSIVGDNSKIQNDYSTKTTNITNYNNSSTSSHSSGEEMIAVWLLAFVMSILLIMQNYIPIFVGLSILMVLLFIASRNISTGIERSDLDYDFIIALQSQLKLVNFKLIISIVFLIITFVRYSIGSYSSFENISTVREVFELIISNLKLASPIFTLILTIFLNIVFLTQSIFRLVGVLFIPLLNNHHPDSITYGIVNFLAKLCPTDLINKYKFRKYALGIFAMYIFFSFAIEIYFNYAI